MEGAFEPVDKKFVLRAQKTRMRIDLALGTDNQLFETDDRWIGFYGRLCVGNLFRKNGLVVKDYIPIGRPDQNGIQLTGIRDGRGRTIRDHKPIKVRTRTSIANDSTFVLYPSKSKVTSDFVVFVEVNKNKEDFRILGWTSLDKIEKIKISRSESLVHPARQIPKESLRPFGDLVSLLKNKFWKETLTCFQVTAG